MYLKSIEMQGFKSFANKIKLEFKGGITGIVGPNGSGKSNVADAVRWVLGEQSARELRGSSMTDVIFSGTETRKPMGFASVSLCLDNADHVLSDEFEEVTVTRRVYRSGESEYLINGNVCRLKDVSELFFDTGIGKEGYSIIGQGQVEKILSGKPEERRELFDEAAGIVKYKKRKNASVKKLESEKENLTRLNDILSELEKQLAPLKSQSDTAKIFLDKREELKSMEISAFLLESDKKNKELKDIEVKLEIANNDLKNADEEIGRNSVAYEEALKKIEEFDSLIEEKRREISEKNLQREKLEGDIKVLKEQINTLSSSSEFLENRCRELKFQREKARGEAETLKTSKAEIDEKTRSYKEETDSKHELHEQLKAEVNEVDAQIEGKKNELFALLNDRSRIKSEIERYDTMLSQSKEKKRELDERIENAGTGADELDKNIESTLVKLDEVSARIEEYEKRRGEIAGKLQKTDEDIKTLDEQHHELEGEYHEKKARLDSLKNMAERYEGYGNSIRKVMEHKRENKGICGVVADIIKVQEKYETAIETALGGNIQNIVTRDEATAKKMIEMLRETHSGRATFLPLTSIVERNVKETEALSAEGVIGQADTLVEVTDKQYRKVASTLLGNYIVVDNVDNALRLAKSYGYMLRIVTLTGEALTPGGSISGGAFKRSGNLLGRGREIDELNDSMKATLKEIDKVLLNMEELRDNRNSLVSERAKLEDASNEAALERNTIALNLKGYQDRREEISVGLKNIERENSTLEENIVNFTESKQRVSDELNASVEKEREIGNRVEELSRVKREKEAKADEEGAKLAEEDRKYATLISEQRFVEDNLKRLLDSLEETEKELKGHEARLESNRKETEERLARISELEKLIVPDDTRDDKESAELNALIENKEKLSESQNTLFKLRDELSERKVSAERELVRLNSQKERIDAAFDAFRDHMWSEYELTLSGAEEMRDRILGDIVEVRKRVAALRSDIKALGVVNVNSIEQYKEVSERYNFMDGQRQDIIKAEEDLKRAIKELEDEMREQFSREFERIAVQYDKVFKELFGGGHGGLELTDSEDVLEAGIKITAEPPGKKLQNMMQLSGGEKSLSAIALLFGIQKLKPSPFCLLDEIEAALDEANVERFATYLSNLTDNTQYIVITHRRGTMMKADRLYGITMQEKGISTEVNVDLTDEEYD